jgi:hypothetical protein
MGSLVFCFPTAVCVSFTPASVLREGMNAAGSCDMQQSKTYLFGMRNDAHLVNDAEFQVMEAR